jgi:hypothetical protein
VILEMGNNFIQHLLIVRIPCLHPLSIFFIRLRMVVITIPLIFTPRFLFATNP